MPSPFDDGADPTTRHRSQSQPRPSGLHHSSRLPATSADAIVVAAHERLFASDDIAERVSHAVRLGWRSIGLMRRTIWSFGDERVVELLEDSGLTVSSLGWAGGFTGTAGYTYREAIEDGRLALEEAVRVKARSLVIAPGSRGGHTFRHAQRVIIDGLRYLAEVAARRNVPLAVIAAPVQKQYARWTSIDTLELAHQLMDQVASPWVGLAVPLQRWHGHPAAESLLKSLAPHIRMVSSSPCPGFNTQRTAAGPSMAGQIAALQKLKAAGFRGTWELDAHESPVADSTREALASSGYAEIARAVSPADDEA